MDACIDIGSNSVRLYIDDGTNKKFIDTTTLADKLSVTGKLSPDAMERTLAAIVRFYHKAKQQADKIYIFATEAVRAASNSDCFVKRIYDATGIKTDILSPSLEAYAGYIGAAPLDGGMVIDIGGASVEVSAGDKSGKIIYAKSLPLGAVNLLDSAGTNYDDVLNYVQNGILGFNPPKCEKATAIGGTATSLAAMDLNLAEYDSNTTDGYNLELSALKKIVKICFSDKNLTEIFPTLSEKRARIIGHGAVMLCCLLERFGLKKAEVSEKDNIEGYLKYINGKADLIGL